MSARSSPSKTQWFDRRLTVSTAVYRIIKHNVPTTDPQNPGWDTSVLVDGNTGRLRSVDLARGQHLGNSIFNLLWGIHFADLRDWLPYRILVCLFGLFLGTISYTGVYIWWRKRKIRRTANSRGQTRTTRVTRASLSR